MREQWRTDDATTSVSAQPRAAGYRIVRTLGEGDRAVVHLGHATVADVTRSAALKVFRPQATNESIDTELRALERSSHAHVVRLRDLSTAPDGRPSLVLEPLHRGSLARLLAMRAHIEAGEAVTILAPIASALEALHESGVCHGAMGAGAILFRASGAPVIAKFGHASLHEAGAPPITRLANPRLVADVKAFARLSASVLRRIGPEAADLVAWVNDECENGVLSTFVRRFEERIFELGDASAVHWRHDGVAHPAAVPARLLAVTPMAGPERTIAATSLQSGVVEGRRHEATMVARGLRTQLASAATSILAEVGLTERLTALRNRIPRRRRPIVFALILAAGVIALSLALIPQSEAPVTEPSLASETAGGTAPPTSELDAALSEDPVLGDNPVLAFEQLARVRAQCIRDLSVLCLDVVVQDGSAAFDDDVALIIALTRGESPLSSQPWTVRDVVEIERYGDAALVSWTSGESETASALLVKGEAGWRIRDYVAT